MNISVNKHLAALGVALAALFAVMPRSAAAATPASAPPNSGLQMHWFHSHASVRLGFQARESRFGSRAVIGLESMRDLASLKATYRLREGAGGAGAARGGGHHRRRPSSTSCSHPRRPIRASATSRRRARAATLSNLPSDPLLQTVDPTTSLPYEWQFASARVERALELAPGDAEGPRSA